MDKAAYLISTKVQENQFVALREIAVAPLRNLFFFDFLIFYFSLFLDFLE